MAQGEIHVDDIGTRFLVTVMDGTSVVNLSTATTLQLILHEPDATLLTKTAILYTDGSDGKIYYDSISGDLSSEGNWKIQAKIIFTGGATFHSDISNFQVFPNL